MIVSEARREANRRNAAHSTGPKTEEGKSRSRLNAFVHGMAGAGDLLAPQEDAREVAERAAAFTTEFGARGQVGRLFARRAATLSLRIERAAERDLAVRATRAEEARREFDRERRDELAVLVASLDQASDPRPILRELEGSPEGMAYLTDAWTAILDATRNGKADGRDGSWLGLSAEDRVALGTEGLIGRIVEEIDRLKRLAEGMGEVVKAIAAARHQAGILAEFDPSTEGERARRHEAAAERAMYRACRAIAEHRKATEQVLTPPRPSHPGPGNDRRQAQPSFPTATSNPPRGRADSPPRTVAPLGSFRRDDSTVGEDDFSGLPDRAEMVPHTPRTRPNRPDLTKIGAGRR